ncbi:M28 family peptidase [Bacillus sp. SB49]|uniref:M28 family peptidase n=1 Tax=Bacillus sp. SB49 TaxID=1071080 RepID=UPI00042A24EC|nr:M28 family peptidase [Bacillus sp. SB49]QHT47909.1 M28 family peptidase [Bacillus sp. SB49]
MEQRSMVHLKKLAEEIGCRPVGSEANHEAAQYIEECFAGCGLEVEVQTFEVPDWQLTDAYIEVDGRRLEATGNNFSESCAVTGEIVPFCTMDELDASPELHGKIAFLYGELSKENYVPKGFSIYNPEHHRRTIQLLEDKEPSAILFVSMEKGQRVPIVNDWDFRIPSLTVTPETALSVKGTATVVIQSERRQGKTCNVIGRRQGAGREKIILAAHYDTVFDTAGAFDNGSGVALLLALVEEIARRTDWRTGFECIAFSSEEYLGLGDDHYVKEHEAGLKDAIVAMNFDGIGQSLGTNTMTLMAGSEALEKALKRRKHSHPAVQWRTPWYESNHYTFFARGVPSIPFSCTGVSDLLHSKEDTISWISQEKLQEVQSLALEIIEDLQDRQVEWAKKQDS